MSRTAKEAMFSRGIAGIESFVAPSGAQRVGRRSGVGNEHALTARTVASTSMNMAAYSASARDAFRLGAAHTLHRGLSTSPSSSASLSGPRIIRRGLSTGSSFATRPPFEFLTGYAFAGKPRAMEPEPEGEGEGETPGGTEGLEHGNAQGQQTSDRERNQKETAEREQLEQREIGFPPDSEIGRWRNRLLNGGEAGEDALMCASMGSGGEAAGDVAIGVADGVGGWAENGIDPALFS